MLPLPRLLPGGWDLDPSLRVDLPRDMARPQLAAPPQHQATEELTSPSSTGSATSRAAMAAGVGFGVGMAAAVVGLVLRRRSGGYNKRPKVGAQARAGGNLVGGCIDGIRSSGQESC